MCDPTVQYTRPRSTYPFISPCDTRKRFVSLSIRERGWKFRVLSTHTNTATARKTSTTNEMDGWSNKQHLSCCSWMQQTKERMSTNKKRRGTAIGSTNQHKCILNETRAENEKEPAGRIGFWVFRIACMRSTLNLTKKTYVTFLEYTIRWVSGAFINRKTSNGRLKLRILANLSNK